MKKKTCTKLWTYHFNTQRIEILSLLHKKLKCTIVEFIFKIYYTTLVTKDLTAWQSVFIVFRKSLPRITNRNQL